MKLQAIFVILCGALVIGCGSGGIGGGERQPERLRFVHAAPDQEAVNLAVSDIEIVNGLEYQENTGYFDVAEEAVPVRISGHDDALELFDEEQTIEAGTDNTLLLIEDGDALALLLVKDDNENPDVGQGKIRIGHVSPSLDSLDIYITRPETNLNKADPSIPALEFKTFSDYIDVNEGTVRVRVTNNDSKKVLVDSDSFALSDGDIFTILLVDEPGGGTPAEALLLIDDQ